MSLELWYEQWVVQEKENSPGSATDKLCGPGQGP